MQTRANYCSSVLTKYEDMLCPKIGTEAFEKVRLGRKRKEATKDNKVIDDVITTAKFNHTKVSRAKRIIYFLKYF